MNAIQMVMLRTQIKEAVSTTAMENGWDDEKRDKYFSMMLKDKIQNGFKKKCLSLNITWIQKTISH
jgi:hypothetical protein